MSYILPIYWTYFWRTPLNIHSSAVFTVQKPQRKLMQIVIFSWSCYCRHAATFAAIIVALMAGALQWLELVHEAMFSWRNHLIVSLRIRAHKGNPNWTSRMMFLRRGGRRTSKNSPATSEFPRYPSKPRFRRNVATRMRYWSKMRIFHCRGINWSALSPQPIC